MQVALRVCVLGQMMSDNVGSEIRDFVTCNTRNQELCLFQGCNKACSHRSRCIEGIEDLFRLCRTDSSTLRPVPRITKSSFVGLPKMMEQLQSIVLSVRPNIVHCLLKKCSDGRGCILRPVVSLQGNCERIKEKRIVRMQCNIYEVEFSLCLV